MFPNPQEAHPLASRPSLEQYRKRAKDRVKAARSGDVDAIRAWADGWKEIERIAEKVAAFAREQLRTPDLATLANAQFVGMAAALDGKDFV